MPHMDITYSRNLADAVDMDAFCARIADAIRADQNHMAID